MLPGDLIPAKGAFSTLSVEVVRNLEPGEIIGLAGAEEAAVPALQKLRAIHHRQALLLSQGKQVKEVAAITGTTEARIHQLQKTPAFVDLVAYYHDQVITSELDDAKRIQSKLVDAAEMAIDEINDRLENDDKRKALPVGELRKIVEMGADRTVAPPKATTAANSAPPQQITIVVGNKRIEPKVEAAALPAPDASPIIDITPNADEGASS